MPIISYKDGMNPKMTLEDAAYYLGRSQAWVYAALQDRGLSLAGQDNCLYFKHATAQALFQIPFSPKVYVFQILKGGTGKTSLALEFAVRASLYGAKVVCLDLDQQGNLTQAFNQQAEDTPVMVDILAEGYELMDALISVEEGIDLLPSRIENALLDEVLRLKKYPLDRVYRAIFQQLKQFYDVIIVDCPPSLGQSVAAAALPADCLIAPVTPEKFALSGLRATYQSLAELKLSYGKNIPCSVVLNKFEDACPRSLEVWQWLTHHSEFRDNVLQSKIRLSSEMPEAALKMGSVFDQLNPTPIKKDLDQLTQNLLEIGKTNPYKNQVKKSEYIF